MRPSWPSTGSRRSPTTRRRTSPRRRFPREESFFLYIFEFCFSSFRLSPLFSSLPFFSPHAFSSPLFLFISLSPLPQKTHLHSYTKLFGGPDFDAATFYSSFGTTLGIGEASRGGSADILLLSEQGREGPGTPPERDAVKAQAFSLQVLTSLAVGGRGLAGLVRRRMSCFLLFFEVRKRRDKRETIQKFHYTKNSLLLSLFALSLPPKSTSPPQKPGVTPDAAAEAMVVATFPAGASIMKSGVKFELSRAASLAAIFNKALGGAPQDVVESVSRSLGAFLVLLFFFFSFPMDDDDDHLKA